MLVSIIRTVIIYVLVLLSVRLMGKRQLGELQPGELVITILISEIAAIPITDTEIPILQSLIPLMLLVSLEIINSVITRKNVRFRNITDGKPVTIIKDGKLLQKNLKVLRYTIDDVLASLRQKDIFSLSDVDEAIVETNGNLSILLKPSKRPVNVGNLDFGIKEQDEGIPKAIIIDGVILDSALKEENLTSSDIFKKLNNEGIKKDDVLLMTINKPKKFFIILKKEC